MFFILLISGCTNNSPVADLKKDPANSGPLKAQSGIPVSIDSKKFRQFDDIEANHSGTLLDSEYVKSLFPIPDSWYMHSASSFMGRSKFIFPDSISLYYMDCSDGNSNKSLFFTIDKSTKCMVDYKFFLTDCLSCDADTLVNLGYESNNLNGKISYAITAAYWPQKDLKKYMQDGKEKTSVKRENMTVSKEGKIVLSAGK